MLVYRGKLNWSTVIPVIINEQFTFVFPGPKFELGASGTFFWPWSGGMATSTAKIESIVILQTGESQIRFRPITSPSSYHFEAIFSDDMKSVTIVIISFSLKSDPAVLNIEYNSPLATGDPRYFFGKMNWLTYAKDEEMLVIIPHDGDVGSDIIAYWQWTVSASGEAKKNVNFKDIIRTSEETAEGETVTFGEYPTTYYTFNGVISKDGQTFTVNMQNPSGAKGGPFVLRFYRRPVVGDENHDDHRYFGH